jgi:hypothetical protein
MICSTRPSDRRISWTVVNDNDLLCELNLLIK